MTDGINYFPLDAKLNLPSNGVRPHHLLIARNMLHNLDVGIALQGVRRPIVMLSALRSPRHAVDMLLLGGR